MGQVKIQTAHPTGPSEQTYGSSSIICVQTLPAIIFELEAQTIIRNRNPISANIVTILQKWDKIQETKWIFPKGFR